MTCRVSGKDAVMKLFLILLAIVLLFVVAGCEGKGNGLNLFPKNSAGESRGKNPGGTGRIVGGTVTVILMHKRTTETEGIWIEIKRKEKSGWVQGWVKSESVKFNWKEDSLENLIESKK